MQVRYKWLYVIGFGALNFGLARLAGAVFGPLSAAWVIVSLFLSLAACLAGARMFRGKDEPVDPPRQWWRMTSRPTLARRLGILFLVLAVARVISALATVFGWFGPSRSESADWTLLSEILDVIQLGFLAFLYLNSAVRLKRQLAAEPIGMPVA
ncbi:MAG: hypothetical protein ABI067_16590 [Leifsonia sp.]